MKKIANVAAYLFILSVIFLSAISILGVWDFFSGDVIAKSFQSIGLLAFVAVIILVADHFIEPRKVESLSPLPGEMVTSPDTESEMVFKSMRIFTLVVLIISAALLALLGVMAIWDVFSGEILHKSLASIAIIAFSSLIIVGVCLERENNPILHSKKISGWKIFLIVIVALLVIPYLMSFMMY